MADFTSQVAKGIELLDRKAQERTNCSCGVASCRYNETTSPKIAALQDWRNKIDAETLDMDSTSVCILGQIFGSYDKGLTLLDIQSYGAEYGFSGEMYADLKKEWLRQLGKEQAKPVRIGQVRKEQYSSYGMEVADYLYIEVDGKETKMWVARNGKINGGKFVRYDGRDKSQSSDYSLITAEEIARSFPFVVEPFKPEPGMFVTNDKGDVYYVDQDGDLYPVKDDSYGVTWASMENETGWKEVTLPSGKKFRQIVK
jgi:hypothetical protein